VAGVKLLFSALGHHASRQGCHSWGGVGLTFWSTFLGIGKSAMSVAYEVVGDRSTFFPPPVHAHEFWKLRYNSHSLIQALSSMHFRVFSMFRTGQPPPLCHHP
jgi:hypothetical protein